MIVEVWQRAWENMTRFLVFPPDIRRVIYTANANESLNTRKLPLRVDIRR